MASPARRILRSLPILRRPHPLLLLNRPASTSAAAPSESKEEDVIFIKGSTTTTSSSSSAFSTRDQTSVTVPMSFATGSVIGKRFYKEVTTRRAEDGNGWTVMLDYRTLKTPSKRPLKLPTLSLAKAIAAEWEYQQTDGIRPFTMPLMKLACTALERVPLTRVKIIEHLMKKFHQDLVFCRSPGDSDLTKGVLKKQEEKIDPILDWVESEFGFKPEVHYSFFGGKQGDGLVKAVEDCLKKTNDCELAAIDAMASAAHSLVIPLGIFRGRLGIEEAIELIRLEEDLQVDKWGLVEGGHDVDIADLKHLWLSFCLGLASVWMAILAPNPSQSLFLLRRRPSSPSRPSIKLRLKFTTITNLSSPAPTPLVTEEDDSSSSPLPPPATTAVTVGCKTCGREEIEKGCNGEGRIQGGIATVPGFGWWPIKAYRPCPGFTASGGRYRRRGQSMDEVASGRGKARGSDDKVKSSSKKSQPQL